MSWGAEEVLLGLWSLPVLAILLMVALRRRRHAMEQLGPMIDADVGRRAAVFHRTRFVLISIGLGLVIVALAQPRWGYRWQELQRDGLSVVVVLDTSNSMSATDVSPSRMERAQREVLDLTEILTGDRVGMVIFAGGAYPRMPLTLDYGALQTVVRRTGVTALRSQGSDIGAALDEAAKLLGAASASDRAILLISDGEDQGGRALEVADRLAADDIHIYTMGVGTADGAPIPQSGGGFKKDSEGAMVISRLGEETLKRIASAGRGAYVHSVAGSGDVRAIYEDEIRGKLQGATQSVRRDKVWDERYQWPLGLGLGLLMLGFLTRSSRRRRAQGVAAAALLLLGPRAVGDEGAISRLVAEQVSNPDDLSVAERLGGALFADGQYNRADEVLSSVADRAADPSQRDRARYNAGLSAYRGGRLTEAAEDWQRLLQDGEHPAAQKNLASVQQELAKRLNQDPPSEDQQGDGEQGDGAPQDQPPQSGDTGQQQSDEAQDPQADQPPSEPEGERSPPSGGDTGTPPEPPGERGEITEQDPGDKGDTGTPPEPTRLGSISEQEAQRMFEGVEEGTPRVVLGSGAAGGNDW